MEGKGGKFGDGDQKDQGVVLERLNRCSLFPSPSHPPPLPQPLLSGLHRLLPPRVFLRELLSQRWASEAQTRQSQRKQRLWRHRKHSVSSGLVVNGAWSPMMPTPIRSLQFLARNASADPSRSQVKRGWPRTSPWVDMQNSYVSCGGGARPVEWQQLLLREEVLESAWFSDWDKPGVRGTGAVRCAVGAEPGTRADELLRHLEATPSCTLCALRDRFASRTVSTWQRSVVADVGESPLFATWALIQAWLWRFL